MMEGAVMAALSGKTMEWSFAHSMSIGQVDKDVFMSIFYLVQSVWFWLILGLLLLIIEILSFATSGFLLCISAGAFGAAIFSHVISDDVIYCLLCFACVTLVSAIVWHFWYKQYSIKKREPSTLNNRIKLLIGYRGVLDSPIVSGSGRMVVGDTTWSVTSDEDLPAGTSIEVVGAKGIVLIVKKI